MLTAPFSKIVKNTLFTSIRFFSTTDYSDLKYHNCNFEVKDYGVGLISINRPKALNAL